MTHTTTDLSNCDREPIRAPGSIQPHGFLIVVDPSQWTVLGVSRNARDFLWREPSALIGGSLADLLEPGIVATLQRLQTQPDFRQRACFVGKLSLEGAGEGVLVSLVAHRTGDVVVLEGEPAGMEAPLQVEQELQTFLARLQESESTEELQRLAVREIRRITGFDRCLLYQFDADWHGRVVAEDRNSVLPSYDRHQFPASDIPEPARELYRRNWLRIIPTHTYRPVSIVMGSGTDPADKLDLSLSVLRSVSPIHLEYMRNMGTGSAMSVSLLRDGELWGLISCHSRDRRHVSYGVRAACALLGQFLSLQLAAREKAAELSQRVELTRVMTRLLSQLAQGGGLESPNQSEWLHLGQAAGAAVVSEGRVRSVGETPSSEQVAKLADWIAAQDHDLFFTHRLSAEYSTDGYDESRGSGVLALVLGRQPLRMVLWFRPEVVRVTEWGGDPRKPVRGEVGERRLHPRQSFETWRETVRGTALPWEPAVIAVAGEFRRAVVDLILTRGARS